MKITSGDVSAYFQQTYFKKYCQRTCGICRLENELSDCAFEETYRGLWIDSSKLDGDKQIRVGPYSMAIERLGQYDCLLLENSNTYKVNKSGNIMDVYLCCDFSYYWTVVVAVQHS